MANNTSQMLRRLGRWPATDTMGPRTLGWLRCRPLTETQAGPGTAGPASAETSAEYGASWGCTGHKAGSNDPLDSGRQTPISSGSSSGDGCPSSSGREGPSGLVPEAGGDVEAGAAWLSTQAPVSGRCSADLMPERNLEVRKCCHSPQLVALEESWMVG